MCEGCFSCDMEQVKNTHISMYSVCFCCSVGVLLYSLNFLTSEIFVIYILLPGHIFCV